MAKGKHISEDEIRYIVDVESSKAQQEIHKLEQASKQLRQEQKRRQDQMVALEAAGKKESVQYRNLKKEYAALGKELSDNKRRIADLTSAIRTDDLTMNQLKKQAKQLQRQLDDTSKALNPEAYAALEKRLQEVKERMNSLRLGASSLGESLTSSATQSAFLGNMMANLASVAANAFARITGTINESIEAGIEMARVSDGITKAFNDLDQPGLLDNLRTATKGTVNDVELMKAAVKAKDFRIPLEDLGKYLQFAQLKAQQTGESLDYMVDSIVTGLGRQSPQILDNLGLSASEIKEQTKQTGDFMKAVASIVEGQLAKAGDTYVSAADRAAQRTTELQNAQKSLGDELLPLREAYEEAYGDMQLATINFIGWLVKHREVTLTMVIAMLGLTAATLKQSGALASNVIVTKASAAAQALWNQVATTARGLLIVLRSGFLLLTGNVAAARTAWATLNATMKTNLIYLAVAAVAAGAAALFSYTKRLQEASAAEKTIKKIRAEAAKTVEEERMKIDMLTKRIHDNTLSLSQRREAIAQLQKIVPDYTAKLSAEGKVYDENTAALKRYIDKLKEKALLEGAKKELEKLGQQKAELLVQQNVARQELERLRQEQQQFVESQSSRPQTSGGAVAAGSAYTYSSYSAGVTGKRKEISDRDKEIASVDQTIAAIGDEFGGKLFKDAATSSQRSEGAGASKRRDRERRSEASASTNIDELRKRRQAELKAEQTAHEERLRLLSEQLSKEELLRGEYDRRVEATEMAHQSKLVSIETDYTEQAKNLAVKDQKEKQKLITEQQDNELKARNALRDREIQARQRFVDMMKDMDLQALPDADREEQEQQLRLAALHDTYKVALDYAREHGENALLVEQSYYAAREKLERDYEQRRQQREYQAKVTAGTNTAGDDMENERAALKAKLDAGLISYEQYKQAELRLEKEYEQKKFQVRQQYGLASQAELFEQEMEQLREQHEKQMLTEEEFEQAKTKLKADHLKEQFDYWSNLVGSAIKSLQDAELRQVEAKYDGQIEAARRAGEDTTELENKKAEEELKIRKKYADVDFAVQASQLIANTAVAIMGAWATFKGNPVAAGIATALISAASLAQLAALNAERQKVKNMTLGGSSTESQAAGERVATGYEEGGYIGVTRRQDSRRYRARYDPLRRGYVDRPTVLVGEGPAGQSREWVASNEALKNPTVAPIIDLIDRAQQSGQIRSLNLDRYWQPSRPSPPPVPPRGEGSASPPPVPPRGEGSAASHLSPQGGNTGGLTGLAGTIDRLNAAIDKLSTDGLPAIVALDDIEARQKLRQRQRNVAAK